MLGRLHSVLLTLVLLAGCIASPQDVDTANADEGPARSPMMERLGAQPAAKPVDAAPASSESATPPALDPNATWYLATVMADASTGLSAFDWTVPEDAKVPWGYAEDFDSDMEVIPLEIALLTEGAPLPTTWGFLTFEEEDGLVFPTDGYAHVPMTTTFYTGASPLTPIGVSGEDAAPSETAFVQLSAHDAGTVLRFVLLAKTEEPTEIGLAFRVLDHDPNYQDSDEEPAETVDAFLAARNGTRPIALPSQATGSGFSAHVYSDVLLGGITPGAVIGIEMVAGEPTYEWNVPPVVRATGGAHTLHASVAGSIEHGFDLVSSDYFSWSLGAARYEASVSLQGESDSVGGVDPDAWVTIFTPTGMSFMPGGGIIGTGDGDGESGATLDVERVLVPGLVAAASVGIIEFGATVEELTGKPAAPAIEKMDAGGLPPTMDPRIGFQLPLPGGGLLTLRAAR